MDTEAEFAAYAREAWPTLVRSAVFLGCAPHEAEDVAQTALVRCYAAWDRVAAADDRGAYVYRVLLNCLRDSRRRRWWGERPTEHLPEPADGSGVAPDTATAVATADAVHRALAGLGRGHRDVVVLRYFAGLSEAETAAALGIARGTVKSRLSRSLGRLAADRHLRDLRPSAATATPSTDTAGAADAPSDLTGDPS